MSNFGESEKEKGQRIIRPLDTPLLQRKQKVCVCSKGMALEFTGYVHVGEVVCRQCGIDVKTRASGIHKNAGSHL